MILCGSVSAWIEKNIISSTAFFGRISLFLTLEELPLNDCHNLLLSKGFRGSPMEEFKILGVTGGVPWYLEQIQAGVNADDNIRDLCFRREGVLFNEFNAIFHDLFEKRSEIYRAIIEVLSSGPKEFKDLSIELNYSKSGTLTEYLKDLTESGFISRDFTWSVKSGEPSLYSHFRLSDNYLRFYLKQIIQNRDKILRNGFAQQAIASLPGWNSMMGMQFENLVLKNRKKIWEKLGIKPERYRSRQPLLSKTDSLKEGLSNRLPHPNEIQYTFCLRSEIFYPPTKI